MASGFFKRAMVYLGLVDDEYDEYDEYEPRAPVGQRLSSRVSLAADEEDEPTSAVATSTIRPLPREDFPMVTPTVTPRSVVRPVAAEPGARVHVVAPMQFGDARQIADRLISR
jgi:FtsZ-interacting cell division protein YlmF